MRNYRVTQLVDFGDAFLGCGRPHGRRRRARIDLGHRLEKSVSEKSGKKRLGEPTKLTYVYDSEKPQALEP